jgi:hypothetical protein
MIFPSSSSRRVARRVASRALPFPTRYALEEQQEQNEKLKRAMTMSKKTLSRKVKEGEQAHVGAMKKSSTIAMKLAHLQVVHIHVVHRCHVRAKEQAGRQAGSRQAGACRQTTTTTTMPITAWLAGWLAGADDDNEDDADHGVAGWLADWLARLACVCAPVGAVGVLIMAASVVVVVVVVIGGGALLL